MSLTEIIKQRKVWENINNHDIYKEMGYRNLSIREKYVDKKGHLRVLTLFVRKAEGVALLDAFDRRCQDWRSLKLRIEDRAILPS